MDTYKISLITTYPDTEQSDMYTENHGTILLQASNYDIADTFAKALLHFSDYGAEFYSIEEVE